MPRYTVIEKPTFINSQLCGVGEVVEFAGWPGTTLEPADEMAKRVKNYFAAHRRDRKLPRKPDLAMFAVEEKAAPTVKEKTDA